VCCNFTPVPRHDYRLGVPRSGVYDEIFNGDSAWYGGGNLGNAGLLQSEPVPHHGRSHSVTLTLPPLAAVVLKPRRS
jgi:1,4-alpha-glucan branching enzyme